MAGAPAPRGCHNLPMSLHPAPRVRIQTRDFDLAATGDLVRARLTVKTQGYGFLWSGPATIR